MRRAVLAFGSTVAGLILLLSFRSHTASTASAGTTAAGTSPTPAAAGAAGTGSPAPSPQATPSRTASGAAGGARVVTGAVINSAYGPSQVAVTLTGSKITKVTILQHTDDGTNSQAIDGDALPKLTAETLAAQSAKIDAVSGASYTSAGYIKSLQSALDQAKA